MGSQPITRKGMDFSQSWNPYTPIWSSSLESLFSTYMYTIYSVHCTMYCVYNWLYSTFYVVKYPCQLSCKFQKCKIIQTKPLSLSLSLCLSVYLSLSFSLSSFLILKLFHSLGISLIIKNVKSSASHETKKNLKPGITTQELIRMHLFYRIVNDLNDQ